MYLKVDFKRIISNKNLLRMALIQLLDSVAENLYLLLVSL
jgi:hypothetical protein